MDYGQYLEAPFPLVLVQFCPLRTPVDQRMERETGYIFLSLLAPRFDTVSLYDYISCQAAPELSSHGALLALFPLPVPVVLRVVTFPLRTSSSLVCSLSPSHTNLSSLLIKASSFDPSEWILFPFKILNDTSVILMLLRVCFFFPRG